MSWFEKLTGFREESAPPIHQHLVVEGAYLQSRVNGKTYACGVLETPSLAELRQHVQSSRYPIGKLRVREEIADVQQLHANPAHAGALFQVASQFNLLEMVSPDIPPEAGITGYANDLTQGPACAIAAGAGTIYRHYFAPVKGNIGQSTTHQIDCLADMGAALGNENSRLWVMRNGYALASKRGLAEINQKLHALDAAGHDALRQLLRIGIQWNTEVTWQSTSRHTVTQTYCSALPVGYSPHPIQEWAAFAQLVLTASYEATLCAGILNARQTGNRTVYLTLLGGGVFGNAMPWIMDAIRHALQRYRDADLEVVIVSYRYTNHHVQQLIQTL